MGYIKHNGMIVTVSAAGNEELSLVYEKAKNLFGSLVSEIIVSPVNGYKTFFIASSGSKVGWEEYDQHENRRQELADYIDSLRFDDNSSLIQFADISYDEEYKVKVERSNFR
ncbi:hypothetical protein [Enterococcus gilvus]|uniref:hypothetical protein n=1 Tax=Enterococcus gilvus TaxID=160453 RepID=UPI003ED99A31